jgi:hypothetical protein
MRTRMLIPLLTLVLVAGCVSQTPNQAAGTRGASPDAGPTPDARFQVTTTSISPGMGLSWGDGRLADNYMDYKFRVEALTLNEWNDRYAESGQQVTLYGSVYHLKDVPDFAGTYTVATPAVTASVGGSDSSRVYQNDKGVIVRITGRFVSGALGMTGNFDVRLLKNDLQSRSELFKGDRALDHRYEAIAVVQGPADDMLCLREWD